MSTYAARRKECTRVARSAALGLTTQNLPRKLRKSSEDTRAPFAAGLSHMLRDESTQVVKMRLHALRRDSGDVDEIMVVAIDKLPVQV